MTSPQDREWRETVVALDIQQERFNRAEQQMAAERDAFHSHLAAGYAEFARSHRARLDALRAETARYAKSLYGEDDEPTPEPAPHQPQDASAIPVPGTAGAVRTNPPNPHAVDLELAEDIRDMSWDEYAQRRAEFGIRSTADIPRRFG